MEFIGAAIPFIAGGAKVLGGVFSFMQGMQANAQSKQMAKVAQSQGRANEAQVLRDVSQTMGRQQSAYAASGVTSEGSPADVMESTRQQGAWNAAQQAYAGELLRLVEDRTGGIVGNG